MASRMTDIAPWPAKVLSRMKLSWLTRSDLHRLIAWRAAAIAAREGRCLSRFRAMASGSTRFSMPSNIADAVRVLLPDPFGPATNVSVATLPGFGCQFAKHDAVSLTRTAGIQTDLIAPSVGHLLYIPAGFVDEHDRMTGG